MKSFSLAVLAFLITVPAFAQQKSPAKMALFCDVKRSDEVILWEKVLASDFFRKVSEASRVGYPSRCVVGKIYGTAASSRIYLDGRNLTSGTSLTNKEVREVERVYRLRPSQCETISCIPTNSPF